MTTLLLNIGSSSVKYEAYDANDNPILQGDITGLRTEHAIWQQTGPSAHKQPLSADDGLDQALSRLLTHLNDLNPDFVLHRVVHGGSDFSKPTMIDEQVLERLKSLIPLAPLHLPSNIAGITHAQKAFPIAKNIAIFDTAFHATLPAKETTYALPNDLCKTHHIQRFGFHGMSHAYASEAAKHHLGVEAFSGIVLHLGSGASMSAIQNNQSIATTMGMTPTGGLIMGTRCGDLDPGIVVYLSKQLQKTPEAIEHMLNHESGLVGLCGVEDMRDCIEQAESGNKQAQLALDCYVERIRDTLAAYLLKVDTPQALVFTGGVGEHAAIIRARILTNMEVFGIQLDDTKNQQRLDKDAMNIHHPESKIQLWVICANEALHMMQSSQQLRSK